MENGKRRRVGARRTRYGWLVVATIAVALSTLTLGAKSSAATAYDSEESQFLRLINEYRQENDLRPVVLSDTLTRSSERHSKDMAEHDFFAHNTEGSSYYPAGSEPWDRMEAEGYRYNTAKGENLAVGYETAEEAMRAWQESPSHNAAMLDGDYRVMGVARINAPGSTHGWYWTTDFGGFLDPSAHTAGKSPAGPADTAPAGEPSTAPQKPPGPPASGRRDAADTPGLENGAMGKARGWSQEARDGADLILDEGYARLGGYHDGQDQLRQKIRVPADSKLVYDVKVRTGGDAATDHMLVRLTDANGEQVATLERHTGRKAAGWERERLDLSRFAGRTLLLSFDARTDAEKLTTFQVDGVTLKR